MLFYLDKAFTILKMQKTFFNKIVSAWFRSNKEQESFSLQSTQ